MMKLQLFSADDGNISFIAEGNSLEDAMYSALVMLGWSPITILENDTEDLEEQQ